VVPAPWFIRSVPLPPGLPPWAGRHRWSYLAQLLADSAIREHAGRN